LARQIPLELRLIEIENVQGALFNLRSDVEDVSDLERSIADRGLIEPIVVRKFHGVYQLICGHRRLQACRNLGWEKIRAMIVDVPDKTAFEMAIIENVQRSSLDPYEEAEAFRRYVSDYGWGGVSELARRIGKSEDFVSHRILLLDLPPSVRVKVGRRLLSVSQASELVWLKNVVSQEEMADKLSQQNVSFRDTRRIVKLVRGGYTVPEAFDALDPAEKKNNSSEVTALKQLRRGILSCRSSLFVLDSVIDQLQGQGGDPGIAATVVLEQRVALHRLIDRMITEKVRLERKIHKLGL
jgi:ParB family chromosome partitioning protein